MNKININVIDFNGGINGGGGVDNDPKFHFFETEAEWEVAQEEFDGDEISFIVETEEIKWGKMPPQPLEPIKFESIVESEISFDVPEDGSMEYSFDKETWLPYESETDIVFGTSEHPFVYFRANCPSGWYYGDCDIYDGYEYVTTISGNIMSLLNPYEEIPLPPNAFYSLFYDETIKDASALVLPATILSESCYESMFQDNRGLILSPTVLPARNLTKYCYSEMFSGCTKLTTAPTFIVENVAEECCYEMFDNCEKLTTINIELPAAELAERCYSFMFSGCERLTTCPELPATTLANSCYEDMFQNCERLTTCPELPATVLFEDCYYDMFIGCVRLTGAVILPAETLESDCYHGMFKDTKINDVTILATNISADNAIKDWLLYADTTGVIKCDASMVATFEADANTPSGWTVEAIS